MTHATQVRRVGGLAAALLLVGILGACDVLESAGDYAPDEPKPDVAIVAFSGRCSWIADPACTPPFGNRTYLEEYDFWARQEVVRAFESQGLTVRYFDASAFVHEHYSTVSSRFEPGYAEAEQFIRDVHERWIDGESDPTRLVLLGHSHGTVWASLLAWNYPALAFDYAIYLDGVCTWWPEDNLINQPLVQDHFRQAGRTPPWPIWDAGTVCGLGFPDLSGAWDVNDVVPWNVAYAVEVRSSGIPYDDDVNVRPNGTRGSSVGMTTLNDTAGHGGVAKAGGSAMNWVVDVIELNGLPSHGVQALQEQRTPLQLPDAPPGFEYAR